MGRGLAVAEFAKNLEKAFPPSISKSLSSSTTDDPLILTIFVEDVLFELDHTLNFDSCSSTQPNLSLARSCISGMGFCQQMQ